MMITSFLVDIYCPLFVHLWGQRGTTGFLGTVHACICVTWLLLVQCMYLFLILFIYFIYLFLYFKIQFLVIRVFARTMVDAC